MISTVTTTTVTAVTGLGEGLAFVAVLAFVALLVAREILTASGRPAAVLVRGMNIALVPLALAFVLIAGSRIAAILG